MSRIPVSLSSSRLFECSARMMRTINYVATFGVVILLAGSHCFGQASKIDQGESSGAKLGKMPESLEVRYVLSALPPHLRDGATTYVLDPAK